MFQGFCLLIPFRVFSQTGNLTGKVKDSTGNSVRNANIYLLHTGFLSRSDKKGVYSIKNIPEGLYRIKTAIIGYPSISKQVTIRENETSRVDFTLHGQVQSLKEVVIKGVPAIGGVGHLAEVHGGVIYSGMKNEVLFMDSLDANTAQDNPREVFGRFPGSNYSETEGAGFPAYGIGFRGLNPTQSIETNTREDGYNITADLYGYPESYYLPPWKRCPESRSSRVPPHWRSVPSSEESSIILLNDLPKTSDLDSVRNKRVVAMA